MFGIHTKNLRGDLFGGLTAGIIALPLALAFGEASGAGPIAGLYGAILVGFFASFFGGTGAQISGPTGPMVVVFAGVYATLNGSPELIFAVVVLAGVIQIVFGVLRFGQYIRLVPYPVVSGFMSGIGCIIIALQTSRLFGHEPDEGGTIPALAAIPGSVIDPNFIALALGILTLVIVFKWPKSLGKYVPAPLAALIIGTVISAIFSGAPILGDIPTGLPSFIMPAFSQDSIFIVVEAAFILAVLGAIDSLLTSLVADNMTRTRHNSNRELIGQGIGNTIAGLFGGVPGAGATMRTAVNIRTGGLTKLAGMTHGLILLAVVLALGPLASQIPHAVLAGILVKTGYDIIDIAYLKRAHKGPRWDLGLMLLVVLLTVFVDLITAVLAGVVMAALAFVKQIADAQLEALGNITNEGLSVPLSEEEAALMNKADGRITLFDFGGPLSFGAAADVGHQVREKSKGISVMLLDFSRVTHVDVSAARAVETIGSDAHVANKEVFVSGMNEEVRSMLKGLNSEYCLSHGDDWKTRLDALRAAVAYLDEVSSGESTSSNAKMASPSPA